MSHVLWLLQGTYLEPSLTGETLADDFSSETNFKTSRVDLVSKCVFLNEMTLISKRSSHFRFSKSLETLLVAISQSCRTKEASVGC